MVLGPYTAGLTATLGLGARLTPRLRLDHPGSAVAVTGLLAASSLTLIVPLPSWLVIAGQTLLVALLVAAGIHLSRLLHDAVPSAMRTAVASGASTLSWLAFLPSSLLFGLLSMDGVHPAGWVVVGLAVSGGAVVVGLSRRAVTRSSPSQSSRPEPACVL